jgi:hypothetical protein
MEGTAPGQLFTVGLVVLQIGFTMKKDTYNHVEI